MPPAHKAGGIFFTMTRNQLLILILLFAGSCTTRKYTCQQLPAERIEFGVIPGGSTSHLGYVLLENGQLFEQNPLQCKELTPVKAKHARKIFKSLEAKAQSGFVLRAPGNYSSAFLTIKYAGVNAEWIWPSLIDRPAPKELMNEQLQLNNWIKERRKLN